jgi:hypothetical protein
VSEETAGSGWFAYAPLSAEDGLEDDAPPVGVIRLMGDYGGAALWDERGAIGEEPDHLQRHLGLSPELVADIAEVNQPRRYPRNSAFTASRSGLAWRSSAQP